MEYPMSHCLSINRGLYEIVTRRILHGIQRESVASLDIPCPVDDTVATTINAG